MTGKDYTTKALALREELNGLDRKLAGAPPEAQVRVQPELMKAVPLVENAEAVAAEIAGTGANLSWVKTNSEMDRVLNGASAAINLARDKVAWAVRQRVATGPEFKWGLLPWVAGAVGLAMLGVAAFGRPQSKTAKAEVRHHGWVGRTLRVAGVLRVKRSGG